MRTSVCVECGNEIEFESGGVWTGPSYWYDPRVLDDDNDGSTCAVTAAEHRPAPEPPDCPSCGDRPLGCSRCTTVDGDGRDALLVD